MKSSSDSTWIRTIRSFHRRWRTLFWTKWTSSNKFYQLPTTCLQQSQLQRRSKRFQRSSILMSHNHRLPRHLHLWTQAKQIRALKNKSRAMKADSKPLTIQRIKPRSMWTIKSLISQPKCLRHKASLITRQTTIQLGRYRVHIHLKARGHALVKSQYAKPSKIKASSKQEWM